MRGGGNEGGRRKKGGRGVHLCWRSYWAIVLFFDCDGERKEGRKEGRRRKEEERKIWRGRLVTLKIAYAHKERTTNETKTRGK
jgi:hypothetical protein